MSFSFWGTSIKAGQSHEFTPPEHTLFHMSNAALDAPHEASSASLIVKTEGKSVTLANFDPQKLTNQQVDLVFPAGVLIEFSVRSNAASSSKSKKSKSSSSVSVSGYLQPSPFEYMEEPAASPTKKRKRSQRGIDGISSEPLESPKKAKLAVGDDEDDSDDEDYDIEDLESDEVDDDEFSASEMLDSDLDEADGPNLDEVLNLGDISSSSDDEAEQEKAAAEEKKSKKNDKKPKDKKAAENPEESIEKAAEEGVEFPMSKSQKKKLKKQKKKSKKAAAAVEAKLDAFDSKAPEEEPEEKAAASASSAKKAKKNDAGEKKKAAAAAEKAAAEKKAAATAAEKKAKKADAAAAEKKAKAAAAAPVEQKKKPQIKEQNGVKYIDFQVGTGKPVKQGKRVKVLYVGSLAKNGKQFDKSLKFPFVFKLGKGEVIKGWDAGIQGMRVGGRRKLLIPSALGYGAQGAKPDIPPHADLRFTVEVVG